MLHNPLSQFDINPSQLKITLLWLHSKHRTLIVIQQSIANCTSKLYQITFCPNSRVIEFTINNTFGASNGLENSFVSQCVFPALHNKSEPVVNALMSLLLQNSQSSKKKPSLAFS